MEQNEKEIIKRAQEGDGEAFSALAQTYSRRLHSLAWRYCRNASDAEDLSQEVWLKAYRALPNFRGEAGFYTWLRQILVNTFLSNHRYKSSRPSVELDAMLEGFESNGFNSESFKSDSFAARIGVSIDENLYHQILIDKVRGFLGDLTPNQRLIFLLKHDEGLTCEEIAQHLECSSGTVKKSLFRTMQKLRQKLEIKQKGQAV